MSKKSKEIIFFVVAFAGFFIVPNVLFGYFSLRSTEMFHQHLKENSEMCYRHAKEDGRDPDWCDETRNAATTAFRAGRSANNSQMILLMVQPILFVLFYSLYNLRKEVEELKKKTDV
jgi:hypothetical protein